MKSIILKIIRCISFVYSPKLDNWITKRSAFFYTNWLRYEFNDIGRQANISKPLYLLGAKYITIGDNFDCDQRLRLDAYDEFLGDKFSPSIVIGDNVSIQKDCHIGAINRVVIGNNVLLASKVFISDHSHGDTTRESIMSRPALRRLFSKGPVVIENNVWIGEGAVILPGVTIGENSIIGANSVVSRSVPRDCVAAGNPAKIIKVII